MYYWKNFEKVDVRRQKSMKNIPEGKDTMEWIDKPAILCFPFLEYNKLTWKYFGGPFVSAAL